MQQRISTEFYLGHDKFFRLMLLTSDAESIEKMMTKFDEDIARVKSECLKLSWYMRGGITYDQVMALSIAERNMISALVKENMETTKKSGLPFF